MREKGDICISVQVSATCSTITCWPGSWFIEIGPFTTTTTKTTLLLPTHSHTRALRMRCTHSRLCMSPPPHHHSSFMLWPYLRRPSPISLDKCCTYDQKIHFRTQSFATFNPLTLFFFKLNGIKFSFFTAMNFVNSKILTLLIPTLNQN